MIFPRQVYPKQTNCPNNKSVCYNDKFCYSKTYKFTYCNNVSSYCILA